MTEDQAMTSLRFRGMPGWLAISFAALVATSVTYAQAFPSGVVRVLVGTGPTSPADIVGRIIANELRQSEGWHVVVENRTGAMQTLAGLELTRSPADGHVMWAISMGASAAPALLRKVAVDLRSDFDPIIALSKSHNVLVVHPAVKAHSLAELIALLRAEPGKLNYASGGNGTPAHLVTELFKLETGTRAAHVPYQNPASMIGDLIGGTTQFSFITTLPVIESINAGKLRPLTVTSENRIAALPSVASIVELGHSKLTLVAWTGLLTRKGTPPATISAINTAVNRALSNVRVIKALANVGADPMGGTAEHFRRFYVSQIEHWGDVVRRAGIKVE